jgi:hypothetical protein
MSRKGPRLIHRWGVGTFGSTTISVSQIAKKKHKMYHFAHTLFLASSDFILDGSERERLVTSVIVKLTAEHPKCTALAHALAVRARTRVELKDWQGAIDDAQIVILGTLREVATESSVSTCYRVWADSEEQLNHKDKAVAVLQDWQKAQPLFRTKLQREVHDLMNP